MQIQKETKFTIITPTEASFEDFYTVFNKEKDTIKGEHIFINFLDSFSVSSTDLEKFSELSETSKSNGNSFVLISDSVDIDDFEDESLSIVPTLGEAEDVLEMDEIERDLGL